MHIMDGISLFSSAKKKKKASAKKHVQQQEPDVLRQTEDGAALNTDGATGGSNVEDNTDSNVGSAGQECGKELQEADSFMQLGLSEWLDKVLRGLGMTQPTEVQRGCIPAILAGRNVIGVAHTGSGKTAAFALPILQKLARDPYGVFALVLTPTRCVCVGAGGRLALAWGLASGDSTLCRFWLTRRKHTGPRPRIQ